MDESKETKVAWWHTVPGVLTAITGIITAITGLIVALHQAGLLGERDKPPPDEKHTSSILQEAKVPNLIGLSRDQAADALKSEGLALGNITTRNTEERVAGTIMAQQPEAGQVIPRGSSVNLVFAQAPPTPKPPPEPPPMPMIKIPDVVGMAIRAARANLDALELQVVRQERNVTDSTKVGVVIEQHPTAGTSLKKGVCPT
jgi:beta-lactam-binding protein with PASTA domain